MPTKPEKNIVEERGEGGGGVQSKMTAETRREWKSLWTEASNWVDRNIQPIRMTLTGLTGLTALLVVRRSAAFRVYTRVSEIPTSTLATHRLVYGTIRGPLQPAAHRQQNITVSFQHVPWAYRLLRRQPKNKQTLSVQLWPLEPCPEAALQSAYKYLQTAVEERPVYCALVKSNEGALQALLYEKWRWLPIRKRSSVNAQLIRRGWCAVHWEDSFLAQQLPREPKSSIIWREWKSMQRWDRRR